MLCGAERRIKKMVERPQWEETEVQRYMWQDIGREGQKRRRGEESDFGKHVRTAC